MMTQQHNLFVQIVGWKYIPPEESSKRCPSQGTIQRNASLIEPIEQVDIEKYPNYIHAVYQDCILGSGGDMLHIPSDSWHSSRWIRVSS
jgi:hypothetical protein